LLRPPVLQVAERARANPKAPGHQAMEHVLKSKKEMRSPARCTFGSLNLHCTLAYAHTQPGRRL